MSDIVLTYERVVGKDIKIKGSLGCSDLDVFVILKNMGLIKGGVGALNFKKVNFRLFKELLDEISSKKTLDTKKWNKAGYALRMPF